MLAAIATLEQKFPRAPGRLLVQCQLAVAEGNSARARQVCVAALTAFAEASLAHLLLGSLDASAAAVAHLRRAIELDPEDKTGWTLLASRYRRGGKGKELAELSGRYRERFGTDLP